MSVASWQFGLFALVAALVYNAVNHGGWRQAVLLVANLAFLSTFASGGAAGFVPFAGFIAAGYAFVWITQASGNPRLGWALIGSTVLLFFWLKHYVFIPAALWLPGPYVVIGLSYIFFRVLQVQIDATQGGLKQAPRPVTYLNYLLNFSTLISGPIQRYEEFTAQQDVAATRAPTLIGAGQAMERIALGLFKMVVLATLLMALHTAAKAALAPDQAIMLRALTALAIAASYAVYLYFNFSGYTDIVIGVARFFRSELPENFDRPFATLNFMDFWGKWHMTLSNWLKTYVYNPLAFRLIRRFPDPALEPWIGVAAFFVTFFLIGLWHGQTAMFVIYGLVLGLGVSGNKLYQNAMTKRLGRKPYRALAGRLWYQVLARGLNFTWFALSLVFFWAGWDEFGALFERLTWSGFALLWPCLWLVSGVVLTAIELLRERLMAVQAGGQPLLASRYVRTVLGTAMLAIAVATAALMAGPAPDIVYKNF